MKMNDACCGDGFKECCELIESEKIGKAQDDNVVLYFKSACDTCRIKFDDCVCKDETKRKCDFLLKSNEVLYLVELKGKKTKDAVEQILSTLEMLEKDEYKMLKSGALAFIGLIVRKDAMPIVPNSSDSNIIKLQKKLYEMSKNYKECKNLDYSYFLKFIKSIPKSNAKRDENLVFLKNTECSGNNPIKLI